MAKTYCTCTGNRSQQTARGGSAGCVASVQSWDGSVVVRNWYEEDNLIVSVGTNEASNCCEDTSPRFVGSLEELKALLNLYKDLKENKAEIVYKK